MTENEKAIVCTAVDMTAKMHRGAWKGRVCPDELDALKRYLTAVASQADKELLEGFGLMGNENYI